MPDPIRPLVIRRHAPLWAIGLKMFEDAIPRFRGKTRILRRLKKWLSRSSSAFPWPMRNSLYVGVSAGDVLSHCGVGWSCFWLGVYDAHVEACIRRFLKAGEVALDIGANVGYFSAVMAACVGPNGRVVSFEPIPNTATQLRLTQQTNKFTNLDVRELALGDQDGSRCLEYAPELSGNASIYARSQPYATHRVSVKLTSLDALDRGNELPACQFVKIDVEGYEAAVFRGGYHYFAKCRPIVLYEFNADLAREAGYTLADLQQHFDSWGGDYQHFMIIESGHLLNIDLPAARVPPGSFVDLVAVPRARLSALAPFYREP